MAFTNQKKYNLDSIIFSPFNLQQITRKKGVILLKLNLKSNVESNELYFNTVYFDSVNVYIKNQNQWEKTPQQSGFLIPMSSKSFQYARTSLVPIPVQKNQTSQYIIALYSTTKTSALATDVSAKIGFHLYTKEGLFIFNTHKNLAFLLSGVLLFMMIINGGIYILGKKKSYLYLVLYNLFFLLAIVSTNGLLYELGLLENTEINRTFRLIMWTVFPIFYLFFGKNYLQLKKRFYKGYIVVISTIILNTLCLIPFLFCNLSLAFTILPYIFPLNALILFICALFLVKTNFVPAKFMFTASLILFLGYLFIFIGIKLNFVPFVFTEVVTVSFLLLELSIFSIAIFSELRYNEKKALIELQKRLEIEQQLNSKNRELISANIKLMNNHEQLNELINNKKINFTQIKQQIKQIKLADSHWEKTLKHFQEVHPLFFDKLAQAYPKLSSNDLKLCAFLKLNLSTKEIASINGISELAISKSRNRLRKKMDMQPGENIIAFINKSIGEI
jgi:hypothetical protein